MPGIRLFALLLTSIVCTHAHAGVLNLNAASGGANVFTFRDFTSSGSDVEGALVAGGNVTLSNYSVNALDKDAYRNANGAGYALVAGGNLTLTSGGINNGLAYVGGKMTLASAATPPLTAAKPLDFAQAQTQYKDLSTALTKVASTGSAAVQWGGVKLTGSGKGGVDVFNVSADLFATSTWWQLQDLVPGETLVFNVSGTSGTFNNGNVGFQPLENFNVLFNFYQATTLNVNSVVGSILAPYATIEGGSGVVHGNVIANAWKANTQIDADHAFKVVDLEGLRLDASTSKASSSNVPEPGSIALILGGLAAAGIARRRRARRVD